MASKVTCAVKFGRFKADKSGYRALMNSSAVQSQVRKHAEATCEAANAVLSEDGYELDGYETVDGVTGTLANGYVVRTKSDHARHDQALYNTLLYAIR